MSKKSDKQPDGADGRMISQAKAAELCGMTREAMQKFVRRGRFRSIEVEGRDLVYLEDIEAFAREHE